MSNKLVTDLTTMQIKSRFTKDLWYIYLGMLGLEEKDTVQHKAYAFVKWVIQKNAKVCLAFLVSPMFYLKLKKLLLESYNCYKDNSESKFTNASFEVFFNEHFTICELLLGNCIPYDRFNLKVTDYNEVVEAKMKFDLIVTNPPYDGEGDPLYMKITKALYDSCLDNTGKLVSINPTGVVDTIYPDSKMNVYTNSLQLEDFKFRDELRNAFSADIKSGIGIFTYSKQGKYRLNSDWVRSIRFGETTWKMRKQIMKRISQFVENGQSIVDMENFDTSNTNIVIINQHTGSKNANTGKYNYDWPVLHSNQYLTIQNGLPKKPHFPIGFNSKNDAINFLKWINTDIVMCLVMTYKKHIRNTKTMLSLIPQPPALDGNYSDEVLMKHFNLTREEMDWIHSEMKDFGWKANLGKTESELMEYIDEINK